MNTSPTTVLKALAIALPLLLLPTIALGFSGNEPYTITFFDDDLVYDFLSETEVFVSGLRNQSATHITIPSTVLCEIIDSEALSNTKRFM